MSDTCLEFQVDFSSSLGVLQLGGWMMMALRNVVVVVVSPDFVHLL